MNKRLSRLEEINLLILTEEFNTLPPDQQGVIYHEALDLCESLGLDRAWRRYKEFLERLQTGRLAELKRRQNMPKCRIAGCTEPITLWCTHTKNGNDPRTEHFCQKSTHLPAYLQSMSALIYTPNFESLTYTLGPRDVGMEAIDHFTCTVERYQG